MLLLLLPQLALSANMPALSAAIVLFMAVSRGFSTCSTPVERSNRSFCRCAQSLQHTYILLLLASACHA
jgi:hypothetical protein